MRYKLGKMTGTQESVTAILAILYYLAIANHFRFELYSQSGAPLGILQLVM